MHSGVSVVSGVAVGEVVGVVVGVGIVVGINGEVDTIVGLRSWYSVDVGVEVVGPKNEMV